MASTLSRLSEPSATSFFRSGNLAEMMPAITPARFGSHVDLVSHPAVDEPLHQVPLVEVVREAQPDVARRIQVSDLRPVELQVQTSEVVLELLHPPRTDDRDDRHGSLPEPRQ